MKRTLMKCAGVTIACVLLMSACGTKSANSRDELTVAIALTPPTLDFTQMTGRQASQGTLYNVMEPLVQMSQEGKVEPLLAKSWDVSRDGRTYTFHLRQGVTFHDGESLTADDVVYSFNKQRDPDASVWADQMSAIAKVTAPDKFTAVVTLKHPSNNWILDICDRAGVIFTPKTFGQLAKHPVGTGPFKFASYDKDQSMILERNDEYWGTEPKLEKVKVVYIEDPSAQLNAIKTGRVDMLENLDAVELIPQIKQDASLKLYQGRSTSQVALVMNDKREPFNNLLVRRAMEYAIDKDAVRKLSYAGYGTLIGTHSYPGLPWYEPLADKYPYNPEKAKKLLAQAGYPNGVPRTLDMYPIPQAFATKAAQAVQGMLADVGMKVKIHQVQYSYWIDNVFGDPWKFDLSMSSHSNPRDIRRFGNPGWYWQWTSDQVVAWQKRADEAVSPEDRDHYYKLIEEKLADQAVAVWLYVLPRLPVARSDVHGVRPNQLVPVLDLRGISISN